MPELAGLLRRWRFCCGLRGFFPVFLAVALIPCIDIDQCSGLRVDIVVFRFSGICVLANSLFLSELGVFCGSVVLVDWRVLVSFGPFLADLV